MGVKEGMRTWKMRGLWWIEISNDTQTLWNSLFDEIPCETKTLLLRWMMFVDDLATHDTTALSTRTTYIASSGALTRPNKQTTKTLTHCCYKQPHLFSLAVHKKKIQQQSDNSWENKVNDTFWFQPPTVPKNFNECNPLDRPAVNGLWGVSARTGPVQWVDGILVKGHMLVLWGSFYYVPARSRERTSMRESLSSPAMEDPSEDHLPIHFSRSPSAVF